LSLYLDTSALVAIYTDEPSSEHVRALVERDPMSVPTISSWCVTEFSSAMAGRQRMGALADAERRDILAHFRDALGERFRLVAVGEDDFRRAAVFANNVALRLRGGDALHLAIAAGQELPVVTLDARMASAATGLGLSVLNR
jgi:uncharacterized protein